MKPKITWFRHNHENRNDLLRFGLMRLHYAGEVVYYEKQFSDAKSYGFSREIVEHPDPRHKSFLLVQQGRNTIKCIVDSEDSFAMVSPLLKEVDVYFCAGYNSDFFQHHRFVNAYKWQDESDLTWYKNTIEQKTEQLGEHFYKIKKYVPIAPNLAFSIRLSPLKRKLRNAENKFNRLLGKGSNYYDDYLGFETRYKYLLSLREQQVRYDITLNDTLWGWPQHRINLHKQLSHLEKEGFQIHSILKWAEPVAHDGSNIKKADSLSFPMVTKPLGDSYEKMLAQSKLAVFACGFHWGWRNIMMFALMVGVPVVTDRLLTEAYFDLKEFELNQIEDHSWKSIEDILSNMTLQKWQEAKAKNQQVYDLYMSPDTVGRYFIKSVNA